jgi:hypothetical protein
MKLITLTTAFVIMMIATPNLPCVLAQDETPDSASVDAEVTFLSRTAGTWQLDLAITKSLYGQRRFHEERAKDTRLTLKLDQSISETIPRRLIEIMAKDGLQVISGGTMINTNRDQERRVPVVFAKSKGQTFIVWFRKVGFQGNEAEGYDDAELLHFSLVPGLTPANDLLFLGGESELEVNKAFRRTPPNDGTNADLRTKCKEVFAEVLRCAIEKDHARFMEITVDRHHGPPTSYWHHSLDTLRAYLSVDDFDEFEAQLVEFGEQCAQIQKQLPTMKFEEPKLKQDTRVLDLDLVARDELSEFDANRKAHEQKLQQPAKLYLVLNAIEINGQTQEGYLGFVIIDDKVLYVPW